MKTVRNIFAGMTVMAMALSFAACGAAETAEVKDEAQTEVAAIAPAAGNTVETTRETEVKTEDNSADYPEIKALLDAAHADDFDAYAAACGTKETYLELERAQMPEEYRDSLDLMEYTDEELQEEWESLIRDEDFFYTAMVMKEMNDDFTFFVTEFTEEEKKEQGLVFDEDDEYAPEGVEFDGKLVNVSDSDGNTAVFEFVSADVENSGTLNMLWLYDTGNEYANEEAVRKTMNANAKTLYNAAAEACADAEMSGEPIADGFYEYYTDGEYEDALGKNITMVFSVTPEYHALCSVTVTDGIVERVIFDPEDGSEVVGIYPDLSDMGSEDEGF